jgi:broad specificity phosphatase PhoE
MKLFLARHTEPEGGRVWTILGHKDVPLSEDGKAHGRALVREFADVPLEAVYCSDLERAWWCAEQAASSKGLTAVRTAALREMDCGALDGMTREEARSRYPEAFEGLRSDPVGYRIPEGETLQEVADRVLPLVKDICDKGLDCVLIVAHAVVNRTIICDAMGLPLENAYRIDQSYGGITIIDYRDGRPVLHTINSPAIPSDFACGAD